MDVLEVARFSTLPEGELAVAILKQHGVDAYLPDRDMATMNPDLLIAIGGVRVVAPSAQIAEARRIIARVRAGDFLDETDEEDGDWQLDATPGKVGELDEREITGAMGCAKKTGAIVILLAIVVFTPVACMFGGYY